MKYKILLAIQLFFTSYIFATVQPPLAQVKSYADKVSWAFEENKGQVIGADSSKVKYFYKAGGLTMFLLNEGIAYQFEKHHYPEGYPQAISKKNSLDHFQSLDSLTKLIRRETYRMDIELIGANQNCEIITEGKSSDYIQYYNHKALDVRAYQKITYKNIYPNIDWVVYLNANRQTSSLSFGEGRGEDNSLFSGEGRGEVKYDFIVHPGGNPSDIRLQTKWVEDTKVNSDGSLNLVTRMGKIAEDKPISFQNGNIINSEFQIQNGIVSFKLDSYNLSQDLVIDPSVSWATLYGGSGTDWARGSSVDFFGNVFLTGYTTSSTNIAAGGHQNTIGTSSTDAFLVKFNSNGVRQWATYYGGTGVEYGNSCAADSFGNIYLAGITASSSNIASSGHQNTYGGNIDGILVKFNGSGVRQWATYYGGSNEENANACYIDKNLNVFIAGWTSSSNAISSGGHQNSYGGAPHDAFLVKFNSNGVRQWGTYYGGAISDYGYSCSSDNTGNVFLCGMTQSPTSISLNGHKNTYVYQTSPFLYYNEEAFLVKFNSSGVRQWGTYYGGFQNETAFDCETDLVGNVYITGETTSDTGITVAGHQSARDSLLDIFLVKFNSSGARQWATYYGGKQDEKEPSCSIDLTGNIYLAGTSFSRNNISMNGWNDTLSGVNDPFLVKFNSNGIRQWGTYYNWGSPLEQGLSCVADRFGYVYLGGGTNSPTVSGINGHQNTTGGGAEAFLVKFYDVPSISIYKDKPDTICLGTTVFFYDTIKNGGTSPKFKWYKNNVLIDTNVSFSTSILNHGDSIKCLLRSNAPGLLVDSAWSNTLRIHFYPISSKNIYDTICSNQSILFNNLPRTNPGIYFDTLISSKGCDSILTLHLAIKPTSSGIRYDSICPGQSILFNGQNVSTAGVYKDTLVNSKGCDSFLDMHLFVKTSTTGVRFDTICHSYLIYFNGQNIGVAGTYFDTLVNSQGCDSFLTMHLMIRPVSNGGINHSICTGNTFFFNGFNRSIAGTYKDTLMNIHSCDSFLTLNLSVKSSDTFHIYPNSLCEPQTFFFNNQNLTTSGTYRDTFTSSQGCDSFVFLHLIVKDTSLNVFTHVTPCDSVSYMFDGILITQPGKYTAKDTNALGCDSTTILNLSFLKPTHTRLSPVQICPDTSYVFDGIARTAADDYIRYYRNTDGCRSTDSLRLTILNTPARVSNPIPACAPFTFRGKTYTSSATVVDTIKSRVGNCDSVIVNNLIQLKPPATSLPDTNFIVCDSIRLNNRFYTTSFSFIDTFRTLGTVCDSVYKKTNYTIRYTPQIGLKVRDTFIRGSQVTLRPNSATNYLWSTGETSRNVSFKLTEDRQLYLIAWNEEPCRDTAYISLVAEDLAIVGMPTGFSPTGEHLENRTLRPNINGRLERFHMMVFNRWGEKVYETFDTQPLGWNGIFKGEPAPSGLYGYVMEYRTLGIIYTRSGEVMLVR